MPLGCSDGFKLGFDQGHSNGLDLGLPLGCSDGLELGFDLGCSDGLLELGYCWVAGLLGYFDGLKLGPN